VAWALGSGDSAVQTLMQRGFYPALVGILIIASLGLPIPEDVPLIAAGVILATKPEIASWHGAIITAMIGIMSGDLILYSAGKRWGRDVVTHRWFNSLITPARFDRMARHFHKWGMGMCFFGRFIVGVRAVMCITAGATRYPYWRFFLADFSGALLSVPFFIWLGYKFAGSLPALKRAIADLQWLVLGLIVVAVLGFIWYEVRVRRRIREENRKYAGTRDDAIDAKASELAPDRLP
jgi:membrane protein DedA with SNARE-associated domain